MTESRVTAAFWGVAVVLSLLAWVTAPRATTYEVFAERGQVIFPDFRDPSAAASLEVIQFDARSATVVPFKVQNRNGRWTIPSQHDYPTDAKDRLAQTATALIALKTDDFVSDNAADHERTGVLDPLDTSLPAVNGRGTRLIARGEQDQILADVIVGNPIPHSPGFRYVRRPGQRRVYSSNVGNLKASTAFEDWIERDLLQVTPDEIDVVNLRNYSVDRDARRINPGDTTLLERRNESDWTINGLGPGQELNLDSLDRLLRSLAALRITGVLPKPAGITATLTREVASTTVTFEDRADLARKGFYLAPTGELLSNQGEIVVRTIRGVFYTLRFGDIAPSAGGSPTTAGAGESAPRESRYLFIMVDFTPSAAQTPGRATEGQERANVLRARFAPWYYAISADSFAELRLRRTDLVKPKGATTAARP